MKIAILSDVHGNIRFFNQCMQEIEDRNVDKIVALGDYYGYMRGGAEVIRILAARGACLLKGNHEAMLLGELPLDAERDKLYGLHEDLQCIPSDIFALLRNMKEKLVLHEEGRKMLFLHGSPECPLTGYVYEDDMEKMFANKTMDYDYIFMGHTHRSFIRRYNGITFVNVGSCGLPRDCGLTPSFCLFDSEKEEVHIIKKIIDKEILGNQEYKTLNPVVYEVFLRRCEDED